MTDPVYTAATPAMGYRTAEQLDELIDELRETFPSLCEVITLPNQTHERKTVRAILLGTTRGEASTVLVTGNVHARELLGGEFCLYLAYNLCRAYTDDLGLICGAKIFSRAQIRTVIEELNLLIVPCVNPDGRNWSLQGALDGVPEKALWRGNRNYWYGYPPSEAVACNGVNLNRNQNFLWNYPTHFRPTASVSTTATPCSDPAQNYRGSAPTSEPETKNLVWLMEEYPYIYAYLDVHGAHGAIVHPWGDDFIQTTDPNMNFRNPSYDGQRDPNEASYAEHMSPEDLETFNQLGRAFSTALNEVRGQDYLVMPSVQLDPSSSWVSGAEITVLTYHAVTGANDDYAYSRHLSNSALGKIYAFTIEYGSPIAAGSDAEEVIAGFQPYIFGEGANILLDLYAGTISFCLEAQTSLPNARSRVMAAVAAILVIIIIIIVTRCG